MEKLAKESTIPQIERHFKKLTTPESIAAYCEGDKRKAVAGMQAGRLTELQNPGFEIKVTIADPENDLADMADAQ